MDSLYRREAKKALDDSRVSEPYWKIIRGGRVDWRDAERERAVTTMAKLLMQEEYDEKMQVSERRAEVTSSRIAAEFHLARIIDGHTEHCYRHQRKSWDRFCDTMEKFAHRPWWIRWIWWRPESSNPEATCQCSTVQRTTEQAPSLNAEPTFWDNHGWLILGMKHISERGCLRTTVDVCTGTIKMVVHLMMTCLSLCESRQQLQTEIGNMFTNVATMLWETLEGGKVTQTMLGSIEKF